MPSEEADGDSRIISRAKILFVGTVLVNGHLDSNSAYQAEAVGIFTGGVFFKLLF